MARVAHRRSRVLALWVLQRVDAPMRRAGWDRPMVSVVQPVAAHIRARRRKAVWLQAWVRQAFHSVAGHPKP